MVRILKRQIARAVEQKIVESLETADQHLTSTLLRLHQESVAKAAYAQMRLPDEVKRLGTGRDVKVTDAEGKSTSVAPAASTDGKTSQQQAPAVQVEPPSKRPGLFTTMLTVVNNNLRTSVATAARKGHEQRVKGKQRREEKEREAERDVEQGGGEGGSRVLRDEEEDGRTEAEAVTPQQELGEMRTGRQDLASQQQQHSQSQVSQQQTTDAPIQV